MHLLQNADDLFVNLVDVITGKLPCTCGKNAVFIEQIEGADPVFQPDVEIIKTMVGCRVHCSGTGVGGDVLTQDQRYLTVFDKRVLKKLALQTASPGLCDRLVLLNAIPQHDFIHHVCSQDHQFRGPFKRTLNQSINQLPMQTDCLIGGKRPWRCCPNHYGNRQCLRSSRLPESSQHIIAINGCEAHVDGEGLFVLIFNFSLSQCRRPDHAPVNRLVALHQVTVTSNPTQSPNDVSLSFGIHGEIGIIPVT